MSGHKDDTQKAAADAASQQAQQEGATNFSNQQALYGNLWGPKGAMSGMLNPANLSITGPTGPRRLQYNAAVAQTADQYQNARGALSRYMAQRGFGSDSPAGFTATEAGNLARDEANAQGQNFTNYTNASYDDALNNFWNSANLASGNMATMGNQGIQGTGDAARTYANLYANSFQPSIWQSIIPAAGTLGAAAIGAFGPKPTPQPSPVY